ncbi:30S ribosomal protein S13 [Mesomycoplasma ovipneumoniae]|uniref:30S ribosomal protein S13 n=1 Tax=Mesomycoplasma ovipneumoniae TaxID=29562 RepID=UPI0029654DF0|nr:30S ribosomal protein S13 [Mesomycoplasma ovipneumoniae]MDW2910871.1 30S ribosomal protein S13 [Mesomycoplasma ovipneumoniae]MDW2913436.1 30S ribosomal protein S13 [Mesomycoplasma ovipneumoniae]MDW2915079.1 30S ribosomal protein S13 [Mesomycoplasma ovipneumoniae]MDW2915761.1 30S ribosomal protein S13 [Mesomycoplasma ovipneumoniae]MDW2917928.1 30S ribosomal protein S13 [Mesomycoplasma ovipneumoniae]
MARILNVEIPNHKRIVIALTSIYGIGKSLAAEIIDKTAAIQQEKFGKKYPILTQDTKVKEIQEDVLQIIRDIAKTYKTEGDLHREVQSNIKRLIEIKCYRGIRHRKGLPVRGQVTQKNARTRKGPRKAIMAKKDKGKK